MNSFTLPDNWLGRRLKVAVLGAGGTGYYVATNLLMLERVLKNVHPDSAFAKIDLFDPKDVAAPNLARTGYVEGEIGYNKAVVLASRLNMALGYHVFNAVPEKADPQKLVGYDIIITATDNLESRMHVANIQSNALWLDTGVDEATASAVLGQLGVDKTLPNSADLFPKVPDEEQHQASSCDMQTSLSKQSFGVNQAIAGHAVNLLAQLMLDGSISYHGCLLDLKSGFTSPIKINEQVWASFGYEQAA